jgi:hypothetical protein
LPKVSKKKKGKKKGRLTEINLLCLVICRSRAFLRGHTGPVFHTWWNYVPRQNPDQIISGPFFILARSICL